MKHPECPALIPSGLDTRPYSYPDPDTTYIPDLLTAEESTVRRGQARAVEKESTQARARAGEERESPVQGRVRVMSQQLVEISMSLQRRAEALIVCLFDFHLSLLQR